MKGFFILSRVLGLSKRLQPLGYFYINSFLESFQILLLGSFVCAYDQISWEKFPIWYYLLCSKGAKSHLKLINSCILEYKRTVPRNLIVYASWKRFRSISKKVNVKLNRPWQLRTCSYFPRLEIHFDLDLRFTCRVLNFEVGIFIVEFQFKSLRANTLLISHENKTGSSK